MTWLILDLIMSLISQSANQVGGMEAEVLQRQSDQPQAGFGFLTSGPSKASTLVKTIHSIKLEIFGKYAL